MAAVDHRTDSIGAANREFAFQVRGLCQPDPGHHAPRSRSSTERLEATRGRRVECARRQPRPARVQLQNKDPRGWSEFANQLADHSTRGSALTMRGVQERRPSLWSLRGSMRNMSVPTLIMAGDEDEPCLEPALMMKRTIVTAGLAVIPRSGHAINLEEPDEFNRLAYGFITAAETGRWTPRDPRAVFPPTRE